MGEVGVRLSFFLTYGARFLTDIITNIQNVDLKTIC